MSLRIKLTEWRLKSISKKLDKLNKDYYGYQRKLRDLYKDSVQKDIYDEQAQMEADRIAAEAWKEGVVVKEDGE